MQKFVTSRVGIDRTLPKLSTLLARRGQSLQDYMQEVGLADDNAVDMHCVSYGIEKDVEHVQPKPEPVVAPKPAKVSEKKSETKAPKNALVSLEKVEDKESTPSEEK